MITKKDTYYLATITILSILVVITSIYLKKAYASTSSIPPTPFHTLQQILKSESDPTPIDANGDGFIDKEAIEGGSFNGVDYAVIIYTTPEGFRVKWSNNAVSISNVAEMHILDSSDTSQLPSQFQSYIKGIRCKNENGWYLVGCASYQPKHILYKNGCYSTQEYNTVACIKFK